MPAPSYARPLDQAKRPVVFFAHGVGDGILAAPTLRALIDIFGPRLTVLTRGRAPYAAFFRRLPEHRDVYLMSGAQSKWDPAEIERVAAQIGNCDLFLSLVPWSSPSLTALLEKLRPATSIGFGPQFKRALTMDATRHSAEMMFDVVRAIRPGLQLMNYAEPLRYSEDEGEFLRSVRSSLHSGTRLLVIHTETLESKMWKRRHFAAFADLFLTRHPHFVAVVADLRPWEWKVSPETSDRLLRLPGLPLEDALTLAQNADLFVGVDSCMLHAADLGNVPSVGLFGRTSAVEFGFLRSPNLTIQASITLDAVTPELVVRAAERMLANPKERATWNV